MANAGLGRAILQTRTFPRFGSRLATSRTCWPALNAQLHPRQQLLVQQRTFSLWPFASKDVATTTPTEEIVKAAPASETAAVTPTSTSPIETATTHVHASPLDVNASLADAEHIHQSIDTSSLISTFKTMKPILQEYDVGQTWFVGTFQKMFIAAHEMSGLPWWASIAVTVFAIRVALFPIVGKMLAHNIRLSNIQPELKPKMEALKSASARKDMVTVSGVQRDLQALFKEHNVHPLRGVLLPLIQAPIFIGVFMALNRMAANAWPEFVNGGALWFTNLTLPDPYWALPTLSAAATIMVLQVGADTGMSADANPQMKTALKLMKVMSFFLIYWMASLPAAVLVYWVTQNSLSLLQALLMKTTVVRKWFNVPERKTPAQIALPNGEPPSPLGFWEGIQHGYKVGQQQQEVVTKEDIVQKGTMVEGVLATKPSPHQTHTTPRAKSHSKTKYRKGQHIKRDSV